MLDHSVGLELAPADRMIALIPDSCKTFFEKFSISTARTSVQTLVDVQIGKFTRWLLGLGHLAVVENDPLPVLVDVADVVTCLSRASHVADKGLQTVLYESANIKHVRNTL